MTIIGLDLKIIFNAAKMRKILNRNNEISVTAGYEDPEKCELNNLSTISNWHL